jgi:LPS sulfotransferase NodH
LGATGLAGHPDEFFGVSQATASYWTARFDVSRPSQYFDRIVASTSTSNGIFGTKLHWGEIRTMRRAVIASLPRPALLGPHPDLDTLMKSKFAEVRYVWLRRRNAVAQGISHFIAARSDIWEMATGDSAAETTLEFDFAGIDECVVQAERHNIEWAEFFRRWRIDPLAMSYEDLSADFDGAVRSVLAFVGVDPRGLPTIQPPLKRLAGDLSAEWEQRYRQQAGRPTAVREQRV